MDLRLIVNADDYGRTPGVSQGIRKAHLEGIVTSTTALMNTPGVEGRLNRHCESAQGWGWCTSGRDQREACPVRGTGTVFDRRRGILS
jgi:hypothetical protein